MPPADDLPCQEFVELVTDYLEEVLPSDVRERFEAHLRVCDGCELYLGQMRLTVRAAAHRRTEPLPAATREKLLAGFAVWRGPGLV
jgi:hypothetical protein